LLKFLLISYFSISRSFH